jgi:hypothetical protein
VQAVRQVRVPVRLRLQLRPEVQHRDAQLQAESPARRGILPCRRRAERRSRLRPVTACQGDVWVKFGLEWQVAEVVLMVTVRALSWSYSTAVTTPIS